MIISNIPELKIHKLTKEQYIRERDAGRLDPNALYATPEDEIKIDTTLTFGGQAADARATGQAIAAINANDVYDDLNNNLNADESYDDPYLTFIDELTNTQIELANVQNELANAQAQLAETQSQLAVIVDSLFYKPGEQIRIHLHTCGVLTASAQKVYFTLPLNKPLKNVTNCIADATFQVRQNGSYLLGNPDTWLNPSDFTFDMSDANSLVGIIHFASPPSGAVNNEAVTVSVHGTITFQ